MDETTEWMWQGFEGPMAAATAAKSAHEALLAGTPPQVGAVRPEPGEPPRPWIRGSLDRGCYAVMVRLDAQVPCPDGMQEIDPAMVPGLVGG